MGGASGVTQADGCTDGGLDIEWMSGLTGLDVCVCVCVLSVLAFKKKKEKRSDSRN